MQVISSTDKVPYFLGLNNTFHPPMSNRHWRVDKIHFVLNLYQVCEPGKVTAQQKHNHPCIRDKLHIC